MELEIAELPPQREQKVIYDDINFIDGDRKWCSFFGAIMHSNEYEIYRIWREYETSIGQYVISKEIAENGAHSETNGEHFHFCAQMTNDTYHRISKRLFKDTFKLRGQARDGLPKQYGKVTVIRDPARMIAYCLKDGDYKTNIPTDELEQYKKISFKKVQTTEQKKGVSFTEKIRDKLNKEYPDKKWRFDCPLDQNIILDTILDNLGNQAKVFDRNTLHKLFNGVQNSLEMTPRYRDKYWKRWKAEIIADEALGRINLNLG